MLIAQLPAVLVVVGTLLMAVVIFAPVRAAAPVTVSFAPPATPVAAPLHAPDVAAWTALVDPCASACDAAARVALVEALAAVRSAWSLSVLRIALADDPSADVRAHAAAALGSEA